MEATVLNLQGTWGPNLAASPKEKRFGELTEVTDLPNSHWFWPQNLLVQTTYEREEEQRWYPAKGLRERGSNIIQSWKYQLVSEEATEWMVQRVNTTGNSVISTPVLLLPKSGRYLGKHASFFTSSTEWVSAFLTLRKICRVTGWNGTLRLPGSISNYFSLFYREKLLLRNISCVFHCT